MMRTLMTTTAMVLALGIGAAQAAEDTKTTNQDTIAPKTATGLQPQAGTEADATVKTDDGTAASGSMSGSTTAGSGSGTTTDAETTSEDTIAPRTETGLQGQSGTAASTDADTSASPDADGGYQAYSAAGEGMVLRDSAGAAITADTLIGMDVKSASGETIGEVSDLIVRRDGEIAGMVVKSGGFLGIGGKDVLVPWSQIQAGAGADGELMVDMTKEQVAQLPPYEGVDSVGAALGARVGTGMSSPATTSGSSLSTPRTTTE